jgi:hypothetical protein
MTKSLTDNLVQWLGIILVATIMAGGSTIWATSGMANSNELRIAQIEQDTANIHDMKTDIEVLKQRSEQAAEERQDIKQDTQQILRELRQGHRLGANGSVDSEGH